MAAALYALHVFFLNLADVVTTEVLLLNQGLLPQAARTSLGQMLSQWCRRQVRLLERNWIRRKRNGKNGRRSAKLRRDQGKSAKRSEGLSVMDEVRIVRRAAPGNDNVTIAPARVLPEGTAKLIRHKPWFQRVMFLVTTMLWTGSASAKGIGDVGMTTLGGSSHPADVGIGIDEDHPTAS